MSGITKKLTLTSTKHGISFETAQTVFNEPLAYIFDDQWHSIEKQRAIIIGHDLNNHLLLVCFTERRRIIHIISVSLAIKKEGSDYEQYSGF